MKNRLTAFVGKARRLESALSINVEDAARRLAGSSTRQPLELALAVVDAIEHEILPAGRGQHVFPFNQVRVRFAARSPRAKTYLEIACEGPPSLQSRIVERLDAARCRVPALTVEVSFAEAAEPEWTHAEFDIEYARAVVSALPVEPSAPSRLELTITHGTAARTVYVFETAPIAMGRGDEVRDSHQRLIRTNQVAFTEAGGEVNQSVSRRHARIEHEAARNAYRLFDDGSAQGTTVVRGGRGLPVSRGTKGLLLQSGDEIVLGHARVHVKM